MSVRHSKSSKSTKAIDWRVYRLGGPKATLLGHVTAPNMETALAKAYDEFQVEDAAGRKRIIVRRS